MALTKNIGVVGPMWGRYALSKSPWCIVEVTEQLTILEEFTLLRYRHIKNLKPSKLFKIVLCHDIFFCC